VRTAGVIWLLLDVPFWKREKDRLGENICTMVILLINNGMSAAFFLLEIATLILLFV
jgi:hypothetical protein